MNDYKKYELKKLSDFTEDNISICSRKFDLEQFLKNSDECQIATIIITPNQIVTAYSGDNTDFYHASFADGIKYFINNCEIFYKEKELHYIDVYIRTGDSKFVFLSMKHSNIITDKMYDTIINIYNTLDKFKDKDYFITPLSELKKEMRIVKSLDVEEKIIGISIADYLKKGLLQPKLYKKQLKVGRMQSL